MGTFVGRDKTKNVPDNFREFRKVWPRLVDYAETRGVRIAIENCPMIFSWDEWPGGTNLASSPALWDEMFSIVDSPSFGLNLDPSHLVWLMIDYERVVRDYASKLFHVHAKDMEIDRDGLYRNGTASLGMGWQVPRLPGLGEVRWDRFIAALYREGYDFVVSIEHEDRAFEGDGGAGQARLPHRARHPEASASLSAVDYVNLGATGLRVSRVCLGMMSYGAHESREWALEEEAAEPIVRRAVEGGVIFFDTADVYNGGQSEVVTGRLLRKLFGTREEYVLATKVHGRTMPGENGRGLSRKHIMASIDASLERLGHEYVDLYQIHRWDPLTPIAETMEALHDVVKAGKARYIGASSMYAWQFAKAQRVAKTPFVSMQNHYNLVYREEEREMIPQCIDQGVGVLPWSPLARGLLAGSRTREGERLTTRARTDPFGDSLYTPEVDFTVVDRVSDVAAARGVPPAQVALAWLLHRPGVTAPIVGATKIEHVEDALAAEQLVLADDELARLEELYVPHAVSGH